ncbi:hypothetical protein [Haloferula sp. BvORR071]|uniref:hypothetical protein n=1 Tax=Haloferula sp. BvORR071 TaxID=1396141 RepID=UPI002240F1AE|nr:hypothetical protein [Haloferula sp. BvORR071]
MRFDRNSTAASLLVVLACGLVVVPVGDRGKVSADLPMSAAPAKSAQRLSLKKAEEAVARIHSIAGRAIVDVEFKIERRSLDKAVALLGETETLRILENRHYWPEPIPEDDASHRRWERLLPLREALLGRLGTMNPGIALNRFPSGAQAILRAAAAVDGPAALKLWLETRDGWRTGGMPPGLYGSSEWIEGVGEIPLIGSPGARESAIGASLVEGWASADLEGAWEEIGKVESELHSAPELNALVRELPAGSDWSEWAARLLPIPWKNDWYDNVEESQNPMLTLTKRWIKDDPDAAFAWLREQQVKWDEEFRAALSTEDYPINRGSVPSWPLSATTGHTVFVEGEVFVLADWLRSRLAEALEWMNANPVKDEILADTIEWSRLPSSTKIDLIRRIGNPSTRGSAATTLAWIEAPATTRGQEREGELAKFHSLMTELQAIENIQEDQKARLARIAAEGKSGAYERVQSE